MLRISGLLAQHRRDIEALDRRILHLVCERLELARQIGEEKVRQAIPLRNFEIETQVYHRFEEAGQALGLDAALGRDLARFLIDKAVEEQASWRDTNYAGDELNAVVVGGKGGMGRWFSRFLSGQGHRVRIVDPAAVPSELPQVENQQELAAADLIVVAVPMSSCAEVLQEIALLTPRGVVAELCSLKAHLQETVAALRAEGMRLVSFHPLFGPQVRMLAGRTIVFCNDGEREDIEVLRRLFEKTSAELVELTPNEHDRRMAVVLGLTHLSNLAFARALASSGLTAAQLEEVAGVTYSRQLTTIREVAGENPSLYFEIQSLGCRTTEAGEWLKAAVDDWLEAAAQANAASFNELMQHSRSFIDGQE